MEKGPVLIFWEWVKKISNTFVYRGRNFGPSLHPHQPKGEGGGIFKASVSLLNKFFEGEKLIFILGEGKFGQHFLV